MRIKNSKKGAYKMINLKRSRKLSKRKKKIKINLRNKSTSINSNKIN